MKMSGVPHLVCVWALLLAHSRLVHSELQFLEKQEGESVTLPCEIQQSTGSAVGIYLKRAWLKRTNVLFMYTNSEFNVEDPDDKERITVSGDPSSKAVSISISELRATDTDRYQCDFMVSNSHSEDEHVIGKTEFFLLVHAAPGSGDIEKVEVCAGGSAVIPCAPPLAGGTAVEGVSLKRRRGRAPVELLYDSKRQHGGEPPSSAFTAERVQLSTVPGPGGIAYNLSLRHLQPEDSGLYSCQLLVSGQRGSSTTLGSMAVFVSVQGEECSCSSNSILIYGLSSIVGFLVLLLACVAVCKCKARRSVAEARPPAPIYEEMTGVQDVSRRKLGPPRLDEMEYRDVLVKKPCPENHYESPRGALLPP